MPNYGAWYSYEFRGEKYYEYKNPLSSLCCIAYSYDGMQINTNTFPYTTYWQDKCCEEILWSAPKYMLITWKQE